MDLARRQRVPLLDLHVWVQPLDALIAYKALIGRAADVAELQGQTRGHQQTWSQWPRLHPPRRSPINQQDCLGELRAVAVG